MDDMGRDEAKTTVMQKGGTAVDDRDMSRMGKKQELRVRSEDPPIPWRTTLADRHSATSNSSALSPSLLYFSPRGNARSWQISKCTRLKRQKSMGWATVGRWAPSILP